jgi:hypothetical protein
MGVAMLVTAVRVVIGAVTLQLIPVAMPVTIVVLAILADVSLSLKFKKAEKKISAFLLNYSL